ncbi:MAG: hypothetical protein NT007_17690 [Candidatus Kapabacteria bacterium]|nr:hypothetical protein [Candidatus Kapabacteria bacterium]
MNLNKSEFLDYKLMQMLLPDYVFGTISEEQKLAFENSLPNYPDLQLEIADVRAVFHRVEKMDFNKLIDYKTKNLSVKVNERLHQRRESDDFSLKLRKLFVPAIGVAAVAIFFIYFSNLFNESNEFYILKNSDKDNIAAVLSESNFLDVTVDEKTNVGDYLSELMDIGSLSHNNTQIIDSLFADSGLLNEIDNVNESDKQITSQEVNNNPNVRSDAANYNFNEEDFKFLLEGSENEN